MKKIGFLKSDKIGEKRIAILPSQLSHVNNCNFLYFEKGYGEDLGYTDSDYLNYGAHIVNRSDIFELDIICDPKIGDGSYLTNIPNDKILLGYFHAVQNELLTNLLINNNSICYAWEDMYDEGQHVFWRNNELAGEAAIMHAFLQYGKLPSNTKTALIGRGNVAMGAYRVLTNLGADVTIYNRHMEDKLRNDLHQYDVIVNAVLWDTSRTDHIIYKENLSQLKKGAMIIDISCDTNGGIETSVPTTIDSPVYYVDGVMHYVVDHTPSMIYYDASRYFGNELVKYLDLFVLGDQDTNETLRKSKILESGNVIDSRINIFQNR